MNADKMRKDLLRRIQAFLHGVQIVLEALVGDAVVWTASRRSSPGDLFVLQGHVRWWNPATWALWLRVRVFRDRWGGGVLISTKNTNGHDE